MSVHLIHKQKVHLQTNMSADAFALQNRISNLLKNDLPGKLETLFNRIAPNGKILRIDKLELNLGTISKQNLEADFSRLLIEQLSQALSEKKAYSTASQSAEIPFSEVSQQQSMLDALIYFLHHGYMPWYQVINNFPEWEASILKEFSEKEWRQFMEELKGNTTTSVIQRLALQFSEPLLLKIVFQLHAGLSKTWHALYSETYITFEESLKNKSVPETGIKALFWQQVITVALQATGENDFTTTLSRRIHENIEELQPANNEEISNSKLKGETAEKEFFTNNAGIILLHPFLQMYFLELGLLEEKAFKNTEMQHRAVLLVHYLATGETEVAEFNLLIAKLLCAVDFNEPVPNTIELTEKEKEESANLLKAVTQHWEPLKSTSAEGLRTSFFHREGKLKKTETGWLLSVEQKTIDILLNKLPWGIGIIKLPWMKNTLNVEWN